MPFTLFRGVFVPEAGRPDGDSIRFRPDNPAPLFAIPRRGHPPKINRENGTVQLRFEGIDTMESRAAQPFSSDATASNLALCGVPDGTGESRGYILSTQIGPNGRPIVFVYAGDAPEEDGASIFLDADRLQDSVNFKQVCLGHAYPLFYDTLFDDLRIALADEVRVARSNALGVWSSDKTEHGVLYSGPESVGVIEPIYPKLWRRLDKYSRSEDVSDPLRLIEFSAFLSDSNERVIVPGAMSTGFDNIVRVEGNKVSLKFPPEDVVVISR